MNNINLAGRIIEFSQPKVMGIVNATPDSFFEASQKQCNIDIVNCVSEHLKNGADIIDVGGYSTRPQADYVSPQDEISRIVVAVEAIGNEFGNGINLSIDTFRSEVVAAVVDVWGSGFIVNDVQAAEQDKNMLRIVSENNLPYIAMHSKGNPKSMDSLTDYGDVVKDVMGFFIRKLKQIYSYGIDDVIFDVGFGFAKNIEHNYELISRFDEFNVLNIPQLVGVSRKRMIWQYLDTDATHALNGTTIANMLLLQKGAKILRVHDSLEAGQIIKILNKAKWDF